MTNTSSKDVSSSSGGSCKHANGCCMRWLFCHWTSASWSAWLTKDVVRAEKGVAFDCNWRSLLATAIPVRDVNERRLSTQLMTLHWFMRWATTNSHQVQNGVAHTACSGTLFCILESVTLSPPYVDALCAHSAYLSANHIVNSQRDLLIGQSVK